MPTVTGTEGVDSLTGTSGDDTINALGGNDNITVTRGHDTVDGGGGYDQLYTYVPSLSLPAGPLSFTITANRLTDGSGGIDTGFSGIETVQLTVGRNDNVTLDAIAAQAAITAFLGRGAHNVTTGTGNDSVVVNDSSGTIDTGDGIDSVLAWTDFSLNAATVYATQSGNAVIVSQAGRADLTVRNVEQLTLGASNAGGHVDASATTGGVHFYQTAFADSFIGGAGADVVEAVNGIGAGDVYTGGNGADVFGFGTFAAFNGATITDLSTDDRINLAYIAGNVKFIGTAAFSGTAGEVRYVAANGQTQLIGDVDGDGIGESLLTIANAEYRMVESETGSKLLRAAPSLILGTSGNDSLEGTPVDETIQALGGNDGIFVTAGHDVIDGGDGSDRLDIFSLRIGLPAGPHVYTITSNQLTGPGGIDTSFTGIEQVFLLESGGNNVTVNAGTLNIRLEAQLTGGANSITSGSGNDQISVSGGSGSYDGGAGTDWLWMSYANAANANTIYVTEAGGVATFAQAGRANITAQNFETLSVVTSSGALRVDASAFTRAIDFSGTAGADTVIGSTGANQIDSKWDGIGTGDVFTGGGGADWFTFWTFAGMGGATITDFSSDDQIDIHLIPGGTFIGKAAFSGVAGEIRYAYVNGQTQLIGDANGDGVGDSVLTLSNRVMNLFETSPGSDMLKTNVVNTVTGTANSETLSGTTGDDAISALGGNDTVRVSLGLDNVDGGAGTDTLAIDATYFNLVGAPHNYTLTPGHLVGGNGAIDTWFTGIERVQLVDIIGANVTLDAAGLTGAPLSVNVQAGTHSLVGSGGADTFVVGGGSGTVDGGLGNDILSFSTDNSVNGNPVLVSQSGGATILQQAGGPSLSVRNVETIQLAARVGSALNGDASASSVGINFNLTALADRAIGGSGGDTFTIAATGATGAGDLLTGGGGADVYAFTGLAGFNGATITDLAAEDTIRFSTLPVGAQYIGAAEFSGVAGQYRYVAGAGLTGLLADNDGDGVADSALLISNGAFVLAETTTGSGILHIVGQMPANDTGDNVVTGTDGVDYIDTGLGNDTIDGRGGDDIINAGDGNDNVVGGDGNDMIHGGAGNDTIDGGTGYDSISGDDGDDILTGTGNGSSTLPTPLAYDWILGGNGNDRITATNGIFNLFGDAGNDQITLIAGKTGSWIDAGAGDDVISASGTGSITVTANTGGDAITLAGFVGGNVSLGAGNDTLRIVSGGGYTIDMSETFGTGRDRVVIQSLNAGLSITGFDAGEAGDQLDLSAFGDNPFATGALTFSRSGPTSIITIVASGLQIRLENVNYSNLSAYNLNVPNPSFAPIGMTINDTFSDTPTIEWPGNLVGADGNDTINGWGGDDFLFGSGGFDTLHGGDGKDYLDGGSGIDWLYGDAGDDEVHGGTGDDHLYAGTGRDLLFGDDGTDYFHIFDVAGSSGVLNGGAGYDILMAGPGFTVDAGAGTATSANASYSFTGIEVLALAQGSTGIGSENAESFHVNPDYDDGSSGITVDARGGDDSVFGGAGDDLALGGAGNDHLDGGAGNDRLEGGDGSDWLGGGTGQDWLIGGAGNDGLYGGDGHDTLWGGDGEDILAGGDGDDTISGGAGNDIASYETATSGVTVDLSWLEDQNTQGAGYDTLVSIEGVHGSAYDDHLTGDGGSNILYGGGGNDWLNGGAGDDTLTGGTGSDTFVFDLGSGEDLIFDFTPGTDRIDLSAYGFTSLVAVKAVTLDQTDGARISLGGGNWISLHGVTLAQLTANDFILAGAQASEGMDKGAPVMAWDGAEKDGDSAGAALAALFHGGEDAGDPLDTLAFHALGVEGDPFHFA